MSDIILVPLSDNLISEIRKVVPEHIPLAEAVKEIIIRGVDHALSSRS